MFFVFVYPINPINPTLSGTPYYLSPELCSDKPYREKSDCWALGVLLYECCTLSHPFEARNQCALILKIIQEPPTPMPAGLVSHELSTLINWLLEKDSSKRPTIKDILNESFVRAKLEENQLDNLRFNKASSKFELPAILRGCTLTNHLSPPHQFQEYKSEEEEYKSSLLSSSSSQYSDEKYSEQSNHVNNNPTSVIPTSSNNIWRDHPPVLPRPMNGIIRKTTRGTGFEKEKSTGGSREVAVSHTTHFASSPLVRPVKQPANYAVSSSGGLPLDQVRGDR